MRRRCIMAVLAVSALLTAGAGAPAGGRAAPGAAALAPVTWADVLRDPDNLELNLAFARAQLDRGELKGASATLERILLLAPDQPRVRLLYGLVLYRLGEHGGAERELQAALGAELDGGERAEAERALAAIAEARRTTLGELTVAGGFRYDDNRNQAPLHGTRLFLDFRIPAGPEQADTALVTLGRARIAHRLAAQAGHTLFAETTFYSADQLQQNDLDLRLLTADAGASLHLDAFTLVPSARVELVQLARETYRTALGGDLRLSWQVRPTFEPFVALSLDDESYADVRSAPSGEQRTGTRWRAAAGFRWQAAPRIAVEASAARSTKNARADYEGYHALALAVAPTLLLGDGQFLRGEVVARQRTYFGPDRFVSADTRSETEWLARLSYGAPLALFARPLPALAAALDGLEVLIALEQQRTLSNIENYDYLSRRAQVLLTRKFRF